MVRAAFFSMGLNLALCGAGLFFVDDLTLSPNVAESAPQVAALLTTEIRDGKRHLNPPDWLPFSCIGLGGVTMLYAIALPRQ